MSPQTSLSQILLAARQRAQALVSRDVAKLNQLLSPGFHYTNARGAILDKVGYVQKYALDESVVWRSQELSDTKIFFVAGAAVLTARTHDIARFGTFELDAHFRTTQIYEVTKVGWLYVAGHTSSIDK